jgi:hypothetical protein
VRIERRRLLLSGYFIIGLHHQNTGYSIVRASRIGSYGSESEWGNKALMHRELAIAWNDLKAYGQPDCCTDSKYRRVADEANGESDASRSTAGSASNSTFAITGGVILMLVLAAILLYMGILDLSEILPFVEMSDNDCGGDAGDDDAYAMQDDDNDDY